MGGNTFEETKRLNKDEYDNIIKLVENSILMENYDYLLPLRLENKVSHGDVDFIVSDTEKFIKLFEDLNLMKEIKIINLFEDRFGLYSKHILTNELYQIDLLKSWNVESMEITRAYFSYSFANIFFKRLTDIVSRNLKFSFLGIMCSSDKYAIPSTVKCLRIEKRTRLIIDCDFIFELLDLDYLQFKAGFKNEIKLLEFFEKSKYYNQIKFKNNSKFKHDYSRLKPFKNLVDLGLIKVENF
jgi:hypothetical protein